MKDRLVLIFFVFVTMLGLTDCTKESNRDPIAVDPVDFDTVVFEHSMKGWELYSWPNGVDWNYSVLAGTNRLKDCEQVKYQSLVVTGNESLKQLLSRMPEGEEIVWMSEHWLDKIWGNNYKDLMLPPESIVTDVSNYCATQGLDLMIAY